jgi:hypothetical protein
LPLHMWAVEHGGGKAADGVPRDGRLSLEGEIMKAADRQLKTTGLATSAALKREP